MGAEGDEEAVKTEKQDSRFKLRRNSSDLGLRIER